MGISEITESHGFDAQAMSERAFGLTLGAVTLALGAGPALFSRPIRPVLLAISATLLALGLLFPGALYWPKRGWLAVTFRIGQVVQVILMGVLFFAVVTPVALVFRIVGRDPLRRRWEPGAKTYWLPREGATDMQQQF